MRKVRVWLLALLAHLQLLQGALQGAQLPCPPCHCGGDILDCSQVDLPAAGPLAVSNWNISGVGAILLDGSVQLQLPLLPQLPGVHKLSLRHNRLVTLDSGAFTHLSDLTDLDLSHNQLTADAVRADVLRGPWRADSYEPLPLESLDLSHNFLHSLPRRALEHLQHLQLLRLDGNPLKVLDQGSQAALASAKKLRVLSLSGCGFAALPSDLHAVLGGLHSLDLSHNALSAVPAGLPTSLRRLDLDANPIRRLPAGDSLVPPFLHLDNLEELSLSHMPLLEQVAAGAFFGLPHLRALSCTDNPVLRDIQQGAFSHLGPSWALTEVTLRNNSLRWLPPGLLAWHGLTFLDASDNPWLCSCNFSRWATNTLETVNLNSRDAYRCGSPDDLSGQSLWNVTAACSHLLLTGADRRPSMLTHTLLLVVTVLLLSAVSLLAKKYCLSRYRRRPRSSDKQVLCADGDVPKDPVIQPLVHNAAVYVGNGTL